MKLTTQQLACMARGDGVLTDQAWHGCVRYLFALQSDSDPVDCDDWNAAMSVVRDVSTWTLAQSERRYGPAAAACLKLAHTQNMTEPLVHPGDIIPCTFSRRTAPLLYTSSKHSQPRAVSVRVQRRFYAWEYHPVTGLQTPHFSAFYVYESHFEWLIEAVHVLGHFDAMLRKTSAARAAAAGTELEWTADGTWQTLRANLNGLLRCLAIYLAD